MAIETKPRRQRLPVPASLSDLPHVETVHGGNGNGPKRSESPTSSAASPTPLIQSGPSWVQFIAMQTALLLGLGLLFGVIALAFAVNAPQTAAFPEAAAVVPTAVAAIAAAPTITVAPVTAARLPQPTVAPPVGARGPQTVQVALEAREVTGLLAEGIGYTY